MIVEGFPLLFHSQRLVNPRSVRVSGRYLSLVVIFQEDVFVVVDVEDGPGNLSFIIISILPVIIFVVFNLFSMNGLGEPPSKWIVGEGDDLYFVALLDFYPYQPILKIVGV